MIKLIKTNILVAAEKSFLTSSEVQTALLANCLLFASNLKVIIPFLVEWYIKFNFIPPFYAHKNNARKKMYWITDACSTATTQHTVNRNTFLTTLPYFSKNWQNLTSYDTWMVAMFGDLTSSRTIQKRLFWRGQRGRRFTSDFSSFTSDDTHIYELWNAEKQSIINFYVTT